MHRPPGENQGLDSFSTTLCCRNLLSDLTKLLASRAISNPNVDILIPKDQWMECIHGFPGQNSVSPTSCGFDDLYNERSACSRFSLSSITEQWYYKKALASCMNFSSSYDYGCSSCIEAIPDFRDYQLRISNVNANDKKTKILCGVAVLISVVAENLKNSAWIDDFYRCLPASDAFTIITLLLVFLLIKYVSKGKKKRPKPVTQSKEITTWSGLYRFSKAEIENAINHSKVRKSLGRGSAGEVYKGVLPSGQALHRGNISDLRDYQLRISNVSANDKKAKIEHGKGKVLETVVEIQDRHDAAKEIEKSLLELHQVFLDMAVMVEAQGEQMDDIEHHDGTKELKSPKDHQKSSSKWMCIENLLVFLELINPSANLRNKLNPVYVYYEKEGSLRAAISSSSTMLSGRTALLVWLPFTKWHIRFSGIYGCSSCIEAISDFRDYQLRISNVSTNDKKAKIVCGVAVLISVVAENLKNSAWIDDFYRSLPASDAFTREKVDASAKIGEKRARGGYTGSCTNLCTVDRVKKPVSGVRILQDKFPTSLLDSVWNLCKMAVEGQVPDKLGGFSVWNLCNWQSKVSKVGFRPLVMNHFPTKSATLKFLTRMAGSGTEFQHQTSEYLRASQEKEQNSPSIQSYQAS
ncbi:hypothetical protein NC653_040976 [Populus alba x Populus x berolinensis]|uniref:t-SNARE coiled-coil homology domain-containing protein n=1 Tax=Populus alba x Populus x berolinensis TaxID=444605 RepID=A0AAD6PNM5_9ROSI|nr:hypothetical protein NC653_040976 [Populus alba x Populus x berolinensis]